MKRSFVILKRNLITVTAVLALSACTMESPRKLAGGSDGATILPAVPAVAMLQGNQVLPRYAAATGVTNYRSGNPAAPTAIETSELNYRPSFSPTGEASGFGSQMMLGLLDITTVFCQAAQVHENTLGVSDPGRVMYPGMNLAVALPAGGLSAADMGSLVDVSWQRFRGNAVLAAADRAMLIQTVSDVYNALPATVTGNVLGSKGNVTGTKAVMAVPCIIIGSSAASIMSTARM